jgi:hypothetical protein
MRIRGSGSLALAAVLTMGVPGSAQDPDVPGLAVEVSGTSTLVGEEGRGTASLEDGIARQRGAVLITAEQASDPRASGRGTITLNVDAFSGPDGNLSGAQVRFGRMRLENDGGAWEGAFAGRFSGGRFIQTYWLRDEGGYAGLTYVVTAGGQGPVWLSEGLIYPGSPPAGTPAEQVDPSRPAGDPPLATAEGRDAGIATWIGSADG